MSARDELTTLILGKTAPRAADAILDAGYRKPRTITTAEKLDALPDGTVIRDALGFIRERFDDEEARAAYWYRPGVPGWNLSRNFAPHHFPATVLYEPDPS